MNSNPGTSPTFQELIANPRLSADLSDAARDQLMVKGAMATLFQEGTAEAARVLQDLVTRPVVESISQLAFRLLSILAEQGNIDARDGLCLLAIDASISPAQDLAVDRQYLPLDIADQSAFLLLTGQSAAVKDLDPDQKWLTERYSRSSEAVRKRIQQKANQAGLEDWTQIVMAVVDTPGQALFRLVENLPKFTRVAARQMGLDMLGKLAIQGNLDAREAFLDLFLVHGYLPAKEKILETGVLPQDPARRALWFFLSEQWEKYESLDFNQSLLAAGYEQAAQPLRRRIVTQVRRSGRLDWMQAVYRGRRVRWLGDMNDLDWQAVTSLLAGERKWGEFWQLAQVAPPVWSARMLLRLQENTWVPEKEEERAGFSRLLALAEACAGKQVFVHSPISLKNPAIEVNCLEISPSGKMVAAGTAHSAVYLWRLPERQVAQILQTTPGQVWTLAFSRDGQYLTSGHADHKIRIWQLDDHRLIKNLEGHQATVRSLVLSPDGRMAISASFDGQIKLWRYPYGPVIKSIPAHASEIFCLALGQDGEILASGGADRGIHLWSLPAGTLVNTLQAHTDTVTSLAISPDGQYLVSGSRDHTVRIWSLPEGILLQTLTSHQNLVTCLAFHPDGKIFASGGFDGNVFLWSFPEGKSIQPLEGNSGPLTGLCFTPDGETLITAAKNGAIQLWDLRPLLFLSVPIERVRQEDVEEIRDAAEDPRLSEAERKWFQFAGELIQWRRRFDISLVEHQLLQVGEFDIEL